jgi:hypothetical protein
LHVSAQSRSKKSQRNLLVFRGLVLFLVSAFENQCSKSNIASESFSGALQNTWFCSAFAIRCWRISMPAAHLRLRHLGTTRMSQSAVLTVPSRGLGSVLSENHQARTTNVFFENVYEQGEQHEHAAGVRDGRDKRKKSDSRKQQKTSASEQSPENWNAREPNMFAPSVYDADVVNHREECPRSGTRLPRLSAHAQYSERAIYVKLRYFRMSGDVTPTRVIRFLRPNSQQHIHCSSSAFWFSDRDSLVTPLVGPRSW